MIIKKQPNTSGAYPAPQSFNGDLPQGYATINLDLAEFYAHNGFVTLEIENDVVVSYTPNLEAWNAWKPDPIIEARENALNRISGKCSVTIYTGVDIGELHYNFTATTQTNLETIARRISEGTKNFLYRADNEDSQRVYTAEEMSTIINAKDEYIAVNTNYYEQLKVWINRETNVDTLNAIDYGSVLPDDLMLALSTKLSSIGIDIMKYNILLNN